MNILFKKILIITGTFLIILWFQNQDDKKYKRTRNSCYDKYKLPVLVAALVGLALNILSLIDHISYGNNKIVCPIQEKVVSALTLNVTKPFADYKDKLPFVTCDNHLSEQEIFTDMPNF